MHPVTPESSPRRERHVDNATNQRIMMTSHEVTLSRLEHKKHHAMEGTRVRFTPTAQRFGPARPGPLMKLYRERIRLYKQHEAELRVFSKRLIFYDFTGKPIPKDSGLQALMAWYIRTKPALCDLYSSVWSKTDLMTQSFVSLVLPIIYTDDFVQEQIDSFHKRETAREHRLSILGTITRADVNSSQQSRSTGTHDDQVTPKEKASTASLGWIWGDMVGNQNVSDEVMEEELNLVDQLFREAEEDGRKPDAGSISQSTRIQRPRAQKPLEETPRIKGLPPHIRARRKLLIQVIEEGLRQGPRKTSSTNVDATMANKRRTALRSLAECAIGRSLEASPDIESLIKQQGSEAVGSAVQVILQWQSVTERGNGGAENSQSAPPAIPHRWLRLARQSKLEALDRASLSAFTSKALHVSEAELVTPRLASFEEQQHHQRIARSDWALQDDSFGLSEGSPRSRQSSVESKDSVFLPLLPFDKAEWKAFLETPLSSMIFDQLLYLASLELIELYRSHIERWKQWMHLEQPKRSSLTVSMAKDGSTKAEASTMQQEECDDDVGVPFGLCADLGSLESGTSRSPRESRTMISIRNPSAPVSDVPSSRALISLSPSNAATSTASNLLSTVTRSQPHASKTFNRDSKGRVMFGVFRKRDPVSVMMNEASVRTTPGSRLVTSEKDGAERVLLVGQSSATVDSLSTNEGYLSRLERFIQLWPGIDPLHAGFGWDICQPVNTETFVHVKFFKAPILSADILSCFRPHAAPTESIQSTSSSANHVLMPPSNELVCISTILDPGYLIDTRVKCFLLGLSTSTRQRLCLEAPRLRHALLPFLDQTQRFIRLILRREQRNKDLKSDTVQQPPGQLVPPTGQGSKGLQTTASRDNLLAPQYSPSSSPLEGRAGLALHALLARRRSESCPITISCYSLPNCVVFDPAYGRGGASSVIALNTASTSAGLGLGTGHAHGGTYPGSSSSEAFVNTKRRAIVVCTSSPIPLNREPAIRADLSDYLLREHFPVHPALLVTSPSARIYEAEEGSQLQSDLSALSLVNKVSIASVSPSFGSTVLSGYFSTDDSMYNKLLRDSSIRSNRHMLKMVLATQQLLNSVPTCNAYIRNLFGSTGLALVRFTLQFISQDALAASNSPIIDNLRSALINLEMLLGERSTTETETPVCDPNGITDPDELEANWSTYIWLSRAADNAPLLFSAFRGDFGRVVELVEAGHPVNEIVPNMKYFALKRIRGEVSTTRTSHAPSSSANDYTNKPSGHNTEAAPEFAVPTSALSAHVWDLRTPTDWAVLNGHIGVARYLLERGGLIGPEAAAILGIKPNKRDVQSLSFAAAHAATAQSRLAQIKLVTALPNSGTSSQSSKSQSTEVVGLSAPHQAPQVAPPREHPFLRYCRMPIQLTLDADQQQAILRILGAVPADTPLLTAEQKRYLIRIGHELLYGTKVVKLTFQFSAASLLARSASLQGGRIDEFDLEDSSVQLPSYIAQGAGYPHGLPRAALRALAQESIAELEAWIRSVKSEMGAAAMLSLNQAEATGANIISLSGFAESRTRLQTSGDKPIATRSTNPLPSQSANDKLGEAKHSSSGSMELLQQPPSTTEVHAQAHAHAHAHAQHHHSHPQEELYFAFGGPQCRELFCSKDSSLLMPLRTNLQLSKYSHAVNESRANDVAAALALAAIRYVGSAQTSSARPILDDAIDQDGSHSPEQVPDVPLPFVTPDPIAASIVANALGKTTAFIPVPNVTGGADMREANLIPVGPAQIPHLERYVEKLRRKMQEIDLYIESRWAARSNLVRKAVSPKTPQTMPIQCTAPIAHGSEVGDSASGTDALSSGNPPLQTVHTTATSQDPSHPSEAFAPQTKAGDSETAEETELDSLLQLSSNDVFNLDSLIPASESVAPGGPSPSAFPLPVEGTHEAAHEFYRLIFPLLPSRVPSSNLTPSILASLGLPPAPTLESVHMEDTLNQGPRERGAKSHEDRLHHKFALRTRLALKFESTLLVMLDRVYQELAREHLLTAKDQSIFTRLMNRSKESLSQLLRLSKELATTPSFIANEKPNDTIEQELDPIELIMDSSGEPVVRTQTSDITTMIESTTQHDPASCDKTLLQALETFGHICTEESAAYSARYRQRTASTTSSRGTSFAEQALVVDWCFPIPSISLLLPPRENETQLPRFNEIPSALQSRLGIVRTSLSEIEPRKARPAQRVPRYGLGGGGFGNDPTFAWRSGAPSTQSAVDISSAEQDHKVLRIDYRMQLRHEREQEKALKLKAKLAKNADEAEDRRTEMIMGVYKFSREDLRSRLYQHPRLARSRRAAELIQVGLELLDMAKDKESAKGVPAIQQGNVAAAHK